MNLCGNLHPTVQLHVCKAKRPQTNFLIMCLCFTRQLRKAETYKRKMEKKKQWLMTKVMKWTCVWCWVTNPHCVHQTPLVQINLEVIRQFEIHSMCCLYITWMYFSSLWFTWNLFSFLPVRGLFIKIWPTMASICCHCQFHLFVLGDKLSMSCCRLLN